MTEHPTRVERAAENAMLKLLARGAMVLVIPMGGFFGSELWGMARKASEAIIEIKGDVKALAGQLSTRVDGHDLRLTNLERKNDAQDGDLKGLQQQVYQLGTMRATPPNSAEERQREQWQRRQ